MLLEHLAAQPPAAAGDEPGVDYDQTLFVDVPGRWLAAWSETSGFIDPAYHAERLWPGWSAVFHDGGGRIHWSLTGDAGDADAWHSDTFESLCRVYERHLKHELDDATRDELARIVAGADEALALDARHAGRAAAGAPAPATLSSPATRVACVAVVG